MSFQQPFSGYEILARVGSGAMGTVFKARQQKLNRIVALKVLKPSLARNNHYVDRLRREARIVAALNHPNIVAGYDLGEEGGYHFFVMEYVEGRSLKELLAEWGAFPEEQVLDVAIQVAKALDHAFRKGVIHRDVKPGNILIDARGHVKLTDMGLAKGPTDLTITRDGATVGTPQYISPEQARDPQSADVRSDLYSLGATLYHMATGQPPFAGETMAEVLTKVLEERAPTAHGVNPGIGEGLSLVIRKLLAKSPDLRYQTPAELLGDLERVRRLELPEVDLKALDAAERLPARGRTAALLAVGLFVLVLVSALFLWAPWRATVTVDPTVALQRELGERLAAVPDYTGKMGILRDYAARHRGELLRPVVESMRVAVESSFRSELMRLLEVALGEDRAELRAYLRSPGRWRDPDDFLKDVFEPRLEAAHRLRLDDLQPPLLLALEQRFGAARDMEVGRRDGSYLEALQNYLVTDVEEPVDQALGRQDFVAAERVLRRTLEEWFGQQGRPLAAELPALLAAECDRILGETRWRLMERIQQSERRAGEALRAELTRSVEQIQGAGEARDAHRTLRRFQQLLQELEVQYPRGNFRSAADPWVVVDAELRVLERGVHSAVEHLEERTLDRRLQVVFEGLAGGGGLREAIGWLELLEPSLGGAAVRRARHLQLLQLAEQVEQQVLAALLQRGRSVEVRNNGTLAAEISVVDQQGRLCLMAGSGDGRKAGRTPVGPAAVRWSGVLSSLPDELRAKLAADERRLGMAVLMALGGERTQALTEFGMVDVEAARFLADEVMDRLAQIKPVQAADGVAHAMAGLQANLRKGDLEAVRRSLERCQELPGQRSPAEEQLLKDTGLWVQQEQDRQARLARLQQKVQGAEIEVTRALDYVVDVRAQDLVVPEGWQRRAEGLRAVSPEAESLVLQLDEERRNSVLTVLDLRFASAGSLPRALTVDLGGAAVVFGLLQDGAALARVVQSELLDRPDSLRKQLQRLIAEAWTDPRAFVVPGGLHVLRIESSATHTGGRRGQRLRVYLDRVLLADETLAVDVSKVSPQLRLQVTAGTALERVRMEVRNQ